jgi:disulfide bond formation protein DsbB
VIGIGPIAGLAWAIKDSRPGARLVGATMAASLLFGLVNHFLAPGADHVGHVVGPSRTLFGATAVLLVVTEAAGAVLGFAHGFRPARRLA